MNIAEIAHAERRAKVETEAEKPINTWEHDDCCSKHLSRFLRTNPGAASFECPKCGTDWKPEIRGPVRYWQADVVIEVLRLRG